MEVLGQRERINVYKEKFLFYIQRTYFLQIEQLTRNVLFFFYDFKYVLKKITKST